MILLLGGTEDARNLLASIRAAFPKVKIVATAVTPYGARLLRQQDCSVVLEQAMDAGQLAAYIRKHGVKALVDATHPFAENASAQAEEAAEQTGIPYLRYERPESPIAAGDGVYFTRGFPEAALMAARLGWVIFLTIGTRHLAECLHVLPPESEVVVRILPDEKSLRLCLSLGLTPAQIVAMQGPVSQTLNEALFREYRANVVITKESGVTGGTLEKVQAAKACRIPIVLVRRPAGAQARLTPAQIVSALHEIL